MRVNENSLKLGGLYSLTVVFILFALQPLMATEPPPPGKKLPEAYYDRLRSNPNAFKFQNGFLRLTAKAQEGREKIKEGAAPLGILTEVRGHKHILVLPVLYKDTAGNPYDISVLTNELFGTGGSTLSAYYHENSYGFLSVDGIVKPWTRLSHNESYYAGKPFKAEDGSMQPCFGVCRENSKVAELVEEAARANDDPALWGHFDNDGPDDKENTIDDDGKVDFVVIVHPGKGAECQDGAGVALWSHQDLLGNWANHKPFVTKTKSNSKNAGNVQVDDYVLVPSVACGGVTPIQIGVIAHEFGHSLGLPDLYDTSRNPKSEGLGNWDLMAGGSWGGDGNSPGMPVHMSAWSKAYLGWVKPKDITQDLGPITLPPYETTPSEPKVFLITIKSNAANMYYLISNRQKIGFDSKLPGSGLLILRVNEGKLKDGLANNNLNTDPNDMGVAVVEADGKNLLIHHHPDDSFRGGAGDTFPGEEKAVSFDNTTNPTTEGTISVCGIAENSPTVALSMYISQGTCRGQAATKGLSINELLKFPLAHVNEAVVVQGLLRNDATNYFSDPLNLKLRDRHGGELAIIPWVPKERPPGPRGTGPPVLSEFLGHEVELIGRLEEVHPHKYALRVESARNLH
jgi:M6 family metalloprotease-like protein